MYDTLVVIMSAEKHHLLRLCIILQHDSVLWCGNSHSCQNLPNK